MPYIVTTFPPTADLAAAHRRGECICGDQPPRCAVATLDEAREAVIDATPDEIGPPGKVYALAVQIKALPEQGGTIGPLPDGTVIEVERVTLNDLRIGTGTLDLSPAEVIDAFNERSS